MPKDSRLGAEVLLHVQYVDLGNGGCDSRGGAVATGLPEISWQPVAGSPNADRTIGRPGAGIEFTADFRPDGTWHVQVNAC
ncbi:hypothetical protein ACFOWZ_04560 [Lentzea rhizosphaerae]|uniref:Uncharacterized protein n=1 Tax=Lentzea rhizosphaerae TaxID=2041025 RepID=A0ABV8BMM8_9PSEU